LSAVPHDPLPKTRYDMKLSAAGGGPVFIGPHLPIVVKTPGTLGMAAASPRSMLRIARELM